MMKQYEDNMAFCKHLRERGLFDGQDINCWIDFNQQLVSFPLWCPNGTLVGYQKYDWRAEKLRSNHGKYFTWISTHSRPYGFWGMEYVNPSERNNTPLLVMEGVWDAIRAIQAGYRACAMLTATPHRAFVRWFRLLTYGQDTIAIRDNDGENLCSHSLDKLTNRGYTVEGAKDLGDLGQLGAEQWLRKTISL